MQDYNLTLEEINAGIDFLDSYYRDAIGELAQRYPDDQEALYVSYQDLYRWSDRPDATKELREQPGKIHALLTEALASYDLPVDIDLSGACVRIHDMPASETLGVEELWQQEPGTFHGLRGQLQKLDAVRKRPTELVFECKRCGTNTTIPQSDGSLQEPPECVGCERQGPFEILSQASSYEPYRLARLQQPPEETKGGNAAHVDIPLRGRLVDSVEAGDRVTFAGEHTLSDPDDDGLQDDSLNPDGVDIDETDFEEVDTSEYREEIEAIANGDYGDPIEAVVESIAPKVHGLDNHKLAMALQLFGGSRVEYPDGSIDRGDLHVLFIGAPGTAKSTLLRNAEELAPRSVYASGKGASAAGMTAAAVRDDFGSTEWALEAGALVLANKGIACVDEIDKIDDSARSSMHDALESQRVNVNKAGINATLPAQTSLLAAGNPKYGRFDKHASESLSEQIDLGPTLLSRFDLIFLLQDTPDSEKDGEIAEHMIESRRLANAYNDPESDVDGDAFERIEPTIPADVLRAYIAFAKQSVTPRIADSDVAAELKESFTQLRTMNGESEQSAVPVTFRKLEGIQRLAEASARARLSGTVDMCDITRAKELVGESMQQVGVDDDGKLDADIVESGTSASQRDRISTILSIIGDLQSEHESGAPRSDVINNAREEGIDPDKADKDLNRLKVEDKIYSPADAAACVRLSNPN